MEWDTDVYFGVVGEKFASLKGSPMVNLDIYTKERIFNESWTIEEPLRASVKAWGAVFFAMVVTRAFGARRKTLRNALGSLIDAAGLERLGIDPGLRPENLAPGDYIRIAISIGLARGSPCRHPRGPGRRP